MQSPFDSPADGALFELACALRELNYSFVTPTPKTHERVNARPENARAKNLRDVFGWSRTFAPDIVPSGIFECMQRAGIVEPCGDNYRSRLRLSSLHGQLFWHSVFPTVEADAVFFGPDTYRYALAIQNYLHVSTRNARRIVDIGCGAGPGAIVCALAQPNAQVWAVDINPKALQLTGVNAVLAGVQLEARHSDLLTGVDDDFDLIVANPPYLVDPSERAYRHGGGPLGADLSLAIVDAALGRLAPAGTLLLYTGAAIVEGRDLFREEVENRLAQHDVVWNYHEMDVDVFGEELEDGAYAHCDRIAAVVLRATRA
jgi:methylase of polypeptide subunit release factors